MKSSGLCVALSVSLSLTHSSSAIALAGEVTPVCDRTAAAQAGILDEIDGVSDCALVTDAHLAGVTEVSIYAEGALSAGDFDGLTSVTALYLKGQLTSLPAGIFDPLASLTSMDLFASNLSTLPDGVFDQLTKLSALQITGTQLTSLPDGIFDQLNSLTDLYLGNNRLTTLPTGLLSGLSSLDLLDLSGNAVDPLPLMVSLQKVGSDQFKAMAPSGVPFDILLPLSVTKGRISGGATTLTIPKGSVESETLTVSITASVAAVNVGSLPAMPPDHSGYALVKSADLPLIFREPGGSAFTPVCDRTPQVRDKIVASVAEATNCGDVTEAHLAAITHLGLGRLTVLGNTVGEELTTLQDGDLDGLIALDTLALAGGQSTTSIPVGLFDELVSLTNLFLSGNFRSLPEGVFDSLTDIIDLWVLSPELSSLPAGAFDHLTALRTLKVAGPQLGSLPTGVFDELTKLEELHLTNTRLTGLPNGTFHRLTALTELRLGSNQLRSLPSGILGGLTTLRELDLGNNQLSSLPGGIFGGLSALTQLDLESNELATLPAGIFDGLTALTNLNLRYNELTTLPAGFFGRLTALEILLMTGNEFSGLPDGIFKGLTTLTSLDLRQNAVDPLPLIVSLEKVGVGQFKAVAPAGAPFDIVLPLSVTNGTIDGGAASITTPIGSVESETLTVTRVGLDAVTVNLGTLPEPPIEHGGYTLRSNVRSLELFPAAQIGIWSARMTVGTWRRTYPGGYVWTDYGYLQNHRGSISDASFTYRGTAYTVEGIKVSRSNTGYRTDYVNLEVDPGVPSCDAQALQFYVDSRWHPLARRDPDYSRIRRSFSVFAGRELDWRSGQRVQVGIRSVPTLPESPIVTAINEGNQVRLLWTTPCDGGLDITRHEYREKEGNGSFGSWTPIPKSAAGEVNASSYTVTSLSNPSEYTLEVRAVNRLGEGEISAEAIASSRPAVPLSDRSPQVRDGIVGAVPVVSDHLNVTQAHLAAITGLVLGHGSITALKGGDFEGLTALTYLDLSSNELTTLPDGIFEGLTALTYLDLSSNELTTLPDGIFEGLTALTWLRAGGNAVAPLPLVVSLEKVGAERVKAVAPAGAPFEMVLPLIVTNGSISSGTTVITIPAGSVESGALTVTRRADATDAVTVDIGTLPGLPSGHDGYALAKSTDLPVEVFSSGEPATAASETDFNGDGQTDFADFFLFIDAYGTTDARFDLDGNGTVDFADFFKFIDAFNPSGQAKLVAMARELIGLPGETELRQNWPNPFNSETVFSWFLLRPGPVRLEVFSVTGQRLAVLRQGPLPTGYHRLRWDGRDGEGRPLGSGVYLFRLVTGEGMLTKKLTLLR